MRSNKQWLCKWIKFNKYLPLSITIFNCKQWNAKIGCLNAKVGHIQGGKCIVSIWKNASVFPMTYCISCNVEHFYLYVTRVKLMLFRMHNMILNIGHSYGYSIASVFKFDIIIGCSLRWRCVPEFRSYVESIQKSINFIFIKIFIFNPYPATVDIIIIIWNIF